LASAELRLSTVQPGPGLGSRALAAFGTVVLALYAIDGVVSLADNLVRGVSKSNLLTAPRGVIAQLTLVALVAAWVALALTPRLPKRVFAAPLLFSAWWIVGAPPLPLVTNSIDRLDAFGGAAQLASAALAFLVVRIAHGRFRLDPTRFAGPAFRLRSSASFLAFHVFVVAPFLVASLLLGVAAQVERATAGFLTFHAREIRIEERRYRRGDREVRLVGMMHLGESESYLKLFESFRGPSTIVLEEGVSDQDNLLQRPLSYAVAAKALGLSTQPEVESVLEDQENQNEGEDVEFPEVKNADVDVRDFRPETITFLDAAGSVWGAQSPGEAIAALRSFGARKDVQALLSAANEDILKLRNRHLLQAISDALDEYHCVIVPWGALHLAGIEAALNSRGFIEEKVSSRTLLRYATLVEAVPRLLRQEVPPTEVHPPEPSTTPGGAK
jgi:hypothetical protein